MHCNREFDYLGKRITEGLKRIGTTEESIWAIPAKRRGGFYKVLSICVTVASLVTMYAKWCGWSLNDLLDVFSDISVGIFSSVVIIWFLFQSGDVFMSWGKAVRDGIREKGIQKGRQE